MIFPGPAAAIVREQQTLIGEGSPRHLGPQEEKLDRALVTGLMLEVIQETSTLSLDPQSLRHLVKTRLKNSLAANLAGRVTLDRFRHLVNQVDRWFPLYYPLTAAGSPEFRAAGPVATAVTQPAPPGLRLDRLQAWLREEGQDLLPHRPHRKLSRDKLLDFLSRTQGGWFRLKDFTRHFGMDRKTAWEYVQKFLRAGLLRHNQGCSAAVRYALSARFLIVRAEALEPEAQAALSGRQSNPMEQVSD